MRDMKTGNQVEKMNSGLRENFPNGMAQVGGGDEPDHIGSQLRVYFRPDGMNYVAVNPMRAERVPIS